MSTENNFEEILDNEVAARLAIMEEPGYVFPSELKKLDWALIVAIPIVSLVLLIIGEFL